MGFAQLIRNGVAIANRMTMDLQVPVEHYAWIGDDSVHARPIYTPMSVTRMALVDLNQRFLRIEGEDVIQRAVITFLEPIPHNGTADRQEPIDPRDKFVLPNGYTGPIKFISGMENKFEDSPYMLEVILG